MHTDAAEAYIQLSYWKTPDYPAAQLHYTRDIQLNIF